MNARALFAPALAALVLASTACSSTTEAAANEGPIIDSVQAPDSITANNNQYSLPLTIAFHDPEGDAVAKIRYRISPGNVDQTEVVQGASAQATGIQVALVVSGTAPKQTYDYTINLIDDRGAEGPPVTKQVTLK